MDAPPQLMDGRTGDASHATVDHLDGRIYCGLKRHADVAEPAHALARKRYVTNVANQVVNSTKITTVNVFMGDGQTKAIPADLVRRYSLRRYRGCVALCTKSKMLSDLVHNQ